MLLVLAAMLACSDAEETVDPEDALRSARVERYREGIPAFAREVCRKHATDSTEYATACLEAATGFLEEVALLIGRSPLDWEKRVIAIGGICQREAFRYSQSELDERSEPDLLVEGLERAPACLEVQYGLLQDLAREAGEL